MTQARATILAVLIMLTVLAMLCAFVLPFAFCQVVPAPNTYTSNPVLQFQGNQFGYQFDLQGQSTNLYGMGNGMTGYTSHDRNGRITSQGTLYNAIPGNLSTVPLVAPLGASRSMRSSDFQSIRDSSLYQEPSQ